MRKPAFFAYKYLHALRGNAIACSDNETFAASDGARTAVLIWDWRQPVQAVSDRPFYTRVLPAGPAAPAHLRFTHLAPGAYHLEMHRTGYRANDAYSAYLDMGSPPNLNAKQLETLNQLTRDAPQIARVVQVAVTGKLNVALALHTNDIMLVTLTSIKAARASRP